MAHSAPVHLARSHRPAPADQIGADIISLDSFRRRRLAACDSPPVTKKSSSRIRLIVGVTLLGLFDLAVIVSVARAPVPPAAAASIRHR
jgi:hypothetical protein